MRKKILILALALVATFAGSLSQRAQAGGTHYCPQCITYSDGSQCCRGCVCNDQNIPIGCTQNICPPFH